MKLYSYWRSTTSYRVRIALHLKGLSFETVPVDLVKGDQKRDDYAALNPLAGVPTLVLDDGTALTQSMAILDYLDAVYPDMTLLPNDPIERAKVRAAAQTIALEIHPINNLKVGDFLKSDMGQTQDDVIRWMCEWMHRGFTAFQEQIDATGKFCFGDTLTQADLCLIPQLYNAHRWGLDLAPFVRLTDIEKNCLALPAFDAARPENQPDAG